MTTFSAPELCVPLFFSSQKLAYHYFCSVWEGLIRAYHYVCSVFIGFFGLFRKEMYENMWFPEDFLKNSPWIVHYGFQSFSLCNFSFFGPGCGPPHKGTSNEHFVEEFAIGIKKLNFLEQIAGTHDFGSRKKRYAKLGGWKSSHFWSLAKSRPQKWLLFQPPSCAYHYFSRARNLRTIIFVVFGRA